MKTPDLPIGPVDGLVRRKAQPYAVDKLSVVHTYLWHFAVACNGRKRGYKPYPWWYVDAMAGPGVNAFDDGRQCAGSPLIAQTIGDPPVAPAAAGLVFAEGNSALAQALAERTEGDSRVSVLNVDVNDTPRAVLAGVPLAGPRLAFFDPEGFDAHWATLEEFAAHRSGAKKMELLVMLPTHIGMLRTLFLDADPPEWVPEKWDLVFGPLDWRAIYKDRRRGILDSKSGPEQLVELYRAGFRDELAYSDVHRRRVPTQGQTRYWLIFATDSDAGARIMDSVMDQVFVEDPQGSLFPPTDVYR